MQSDRPSPDSHTANRQRSVAVLIPCRDEAAAIGTVVSDFRRALPQAKVYVCDNGSSDGTAVIAASAGAVVRSEELPGKGNAVRRLFSEIEADVYVLVDGDDTYDSNAAPQLVRRLLDEGLDMVVAARAATQKGAYRPGHRFGNIALTSIVGFTFGDRVTDLLSGYRVFSRRYVKSFPALSAGFEIETELTVHALELRMPIAEVTTCYKERRPDSRSKLSTVRDGLRILRTIVSLYRLERPRQFFGLIGLILAVGSMALAWPLLVTYLQTGLVPRLPTAVLATGMMLLAFLSLTCGVVLDAVTRGRREMKRLHYLNVGQFADGRPGSGA